MVQSTHRDSFPQRWAADMAAKYSLLGQGCSGNLYCTHYIAHRAERHIPFELCLVKDSVNFNRPADSVDMHAEPLWTINTCEDSGHTWKFNEEGFWHSEIRLCRRGKGVS